MIRLDNSFKIWDFVKFWILADMWKKGAVKIVDQMWDISNKHEHFDDTAEFLKIRWVLEILNFDDL